MKFLRPDIQNALHGVRRSTASLLDKKSDGIRFKDQVQATVAVVTSLITGREKYASADQNPVGIGDQ